MYKKYTSVVLAIFLLTFLASSRTFSQELKFISMDIAPWGYFDETENRYSGIFPDLVKEIEKITGYNLKIILTPYARINRELESGRQDCTMLIAGKERNKIATQEELVLKLPVGVIADKKKKLNVYTDLYGLKISLLRGAAISKRFDLDDRLNKSFDTDYQISLRKVLHGRLDAVAGALPTIQYLAEKKGMSHILGTPLLLSHEPIYLQCSRKSKNLKYIKNINKAMRELKKSPVLDEIVRRYWQL